MSRTQFEPVTEDCVITKMCLMCTNIRVYKIYKLGTREWETNISDFLLCLYVPPVHCGIWERYVEERIT